MICTVCGRDLAAQGVVYCKAWTHQLYTIMLAIYLLQSAALEAGMLFTACLGDAIRPDVCPAMAAHAPA